MLQQYNVFLNNKALSYDTTLRNGYRMPKKTAPISTKKYIREVMEKTCFAFKVDEIKMTNVIRAPPIKILNSKLMRALDVAI